MKQKNYIIFFVLCWCCSSILQAQSLSPTVVSTAGGYASAGSVKLSYTIGEMSAVSTLKKGAYILTQGFEQADIDQTNALLAQEKDAQDALVVYPNPATNFFYIGYTTPEMGLIKISLYDDKGALVADLNQSKVDGTNHVDKIDCTALAAGTYHITVEYLSAAGIHLYSKERKIIIIN
jgi:hypothetical protein